MGQNWAITIGVNQYEYLQPLNYAQRDAEAMRDYFLQEAGFQQVYHFSADADPIPSDYGPPLNSKPTFGALERFLRVRFQQRFLNSGDNLWFFFAGHGIRHENRDYLMPCDGDPGNIERTAISINYITERLRECGADNVILLIDACRKEGQRHGIGVGQEKQKGVVTIFSCSPNEFSYEIDELAHGSFTYALLEGLRIQGEGNCATVERLSHYVKHRVSQLTQHYRHQPQTPYPVVEPASKYHLILLPQQATMQDAETLKKDAYKAAFDQDWALSRHLWIRVLAVSPGDMEAVDAIERIAMSSTPPVRSQKVIQRDDSSRSGETVPPPILKPKPIIQTTSFGFTVATVSRKKIGGFLGLGGEMEIVINRRQGSAQYIIEDLGHGVTLEMVQIPGGVFMMGAPTTEESSGDRERPQHQVTVPPFSMGKYPITQAQWKAVTSLPQVNRELKPNPSHFKGDNRPVEQVSWYDAVEFCDRLSQYTGQQYRLPSEAEWEYACRAGTTTPFHFGETITTDLVNYDGNYTYGSAPKGQYRKETTPVGSFKMANDFGLYDIHGNVWEWCLDDWHSNYEGAPINGSAWFDDDKNPMEKQGGSVQRGGSWYFYPRYCRSAYRDFINPRVIIVIIVGFRVVCVVPRTLLGS